MPGLTATSNHQPGFHLHTSLPLPSKVRQIDGLQVLRLIAVFLVAWIHSGQELAPNSRGWLPSFGVFGIDIFFVISGFIMSTIVFSSRPHPGPGAAWTFTKRRLIRIFPIYWIFALLKTARLVHSHQFSAAYLPSFFLAPVPPWPRLINLSWTLMFEIFFYATIAALLFVTVRWAVQAAIAILCITAAISVIAGFHLSIWTVAFNPMLLEFVLGAAIAMAYRRFGARRPFGIAMVSVGVMASLYLRAYPPDCAPGMVEILNGQGVLLRIATWGLAAAALVGGTVFWSPAIKTRTGRALVVLGNASYSAYLVSVFVIEYTLRLLLKIPGTGHPLLNSVHALYQVILVLAVLGVGWLSYQFVEWPMVRWLQARL